MIQMKKKKKPVAVERGTSTKEKSSGSGSSEWSNSEDDSTKKTPNIDIVIKDKTSNDADIQRALDESKAEERMREKAIREQEEREIQMAVKLSLADDKKIVSRTQVEKKTQVTPVSADTDTTSEVRQLAGQQLTEAINAFTQGRFVQAGHDIKNAVGTLVKQPKAHQTFQQEIAYSVPYCQAINFLIELQRLQSLMLYEQMGLVSKFLCEIPVPNNNHRLILFRIALKTNFQLGNFETSGRLMQMMAAIPGLPETEILKKMYSKCEEEKFVDHSKPVNSAPKICYKTLRLIITDTFDLCDFCASSYRSSVTQQCIFCLYPVKPVSMAAFLQAQAQAQAMAQAAMAQQGAEKKV